MEVFYIITLIIFATALIASIIIMKFTYDSEVKLKKVSEKISDGYVIFNKSGKITNYNMSFLNLLNIDKKAISKSHIKDVFSKIILDDDDVIKIQKALDNLEAENFEFNIKRNDKILKLEFINLVDNDIFMRYVIIVKDITQNYQMIEDLKVNQEMLTNRERFATLRWAYNWNCTFFKISNIFYNRRT